MNNDRSLWRPFDHPLTAAVSLLLVGLAIYGGILSAPFVFDDYGIIVDNPQIRVTGLSWPAIVDLFRPPSPNRPLAKLTFMLNYRAHRLEVTGYHLVNILLHVLNAGLVFHLLRLTLRRLGREASPAPLLAATLWLALPVHIQSATYIVKRMNVMAATFYLLAVICYAQARVRQGRNRRKGTTMLLFTGCGLSGLLGLLTKETTITLPVFIFLYEWFFFQDLDRAWLKKHLRRLGLITILCALAAMVYLHGRPLEKISETYRNQPFTPAQRLLTQPRVVIYFLSLLAWPHPDRLTLDYDFPLSHGPADPAANLAALAALAALLLLAVFSAPKNRLLSFAILWFLGNLVLESSIIGLPLIFEHRTYLPSILPVTAGSALLLRHIRSRRAAVLLVGIMITVCGIWTWQRNSAWQDKITLWQDCVNKAPANPRACHNLGLALERAGDYDRAARFLRRSLDLSLSRLNSDHPEIGNVCNNLGVALLKAGRYREAEMYFQMALQRQTAVSGPRYLDMAELYHNLGKAAQHLENPVQAAAYFRQALVLKIRTAGAAHPDTAEIYNNLGVASLAAGDQAQAEAWFRRALVVFRHQYGVDHPATRTVRDNLSGLPPVTDRPPEDKQRKAAHAR